MQNSFFVSSKRIRIGQAKGSVPPPTSDKMNTPLTEIKLSHSDQELDFIEPEDAAPVPHCWNCGERGHASSRCPMPIAVVPQCADCGGDAGVHTSPRGNICLPCMSRSFEAEVQSTCIMCAMEPGSMGMGNMCADCYWYPSASHLCIDCGSTDELHHIEHRGKILVRCVDCERGCPCCEGRCADCGRTGHMNRGTRDGEQATLCDVCVDAVEDTRGCGNCSGCAYCMSLGEYDHAGEV